MNDFRYSGLVKAPSHKPTLTPKVPKREEEVNGTEADYIWTISTSF